MSKDNILLVGASGKKGHGKDALCNLLMKQVRSITHDKVKTIRIAFGDPLKDEVAEHFGPLLAGAMVAKQSKSPVLMPDDSAAATHTLRGLLDDPYKKVQFRKILQWWGTEYRREVFGEEYWVERVEEKIKEFAELCEDSTPIVVFLPDCRFPNEAAFVRNSMGYLFRVNNRNISFDPNEHPSENMLDDFHGFDSVVINDYPVLGSVQYPANTRAYVEALAKSHSDLEHSAFGLALTMLENKWGIKR